MEKQKYKITNWPAYNKALKQRGSISLWIDETLKTWFSNQKPGKRGRKRIYSDQAILCMLAIRVVYHLPLRAAEGFIRDLFKREHIQLPVPCYTQISRRAAKLGKNLEQINKKICETKGPIEIAIDATGIKIYGEGEWKMRQYGKSKRRTWRKIHLGISPATHQIECSKLTKSDITDAKAAESMLKNLSKSVKKLYGDGAYDQKSIYKILHAKKIKSIIPPRKNALIQSENQYPCLKDRNESIKTIQKFSNIEEGTKKWKTAINYHLRSLVETAMFRFKTIFGPKFSSRKINQQKAELYVKSIALNKMTALGMPVSQRIFY